MAHVKRKSAFEHVQNVQIQIILHMRKISTGRLLSIQAFFSIQYFCKRTDQGLHFPHLPENTFCMTFKFDNCSVHVMKSSILYASYQSS